MIIAQIHNLYIIILYKWVYNKYKLKKKKQEKKKIFFLEHINHNGK